MFKRKSRARMTITEGDSPNAIKIDLWFHPKNREGDAVPATHQAMLTGLSAILQLLEVTEVKS